MSSRRIRPAGRLFLATVGLMLLLGAVSSLADPGPVRADLSMKHIVLLHSFSYEQAAYMAMDPILARGFAEAGLDLNNLYFEFMDLGRHPERAHWKGVAEHLRRKFEKEPVDLVILLHAIALDFLTQEGRDLFPGVPVINVIAATRFQNEGFREQQERSLKSLNRPFIIMPFSVDTRATVETILRLQPGAGKLLVVSGSGPLDGYLEQTVRNDLRGWQGPLQVEFLSGVPMNTVLARVGTLDPRTAVLITTFYADGAGKPFRPADAGRMISRAATAPVYGLFETLLGNNGVVGGIMVNQAMEAERALHLALDILRGRRPTEPVSILPAPLVPMFDWQQLERWDLSGRALPSGSIVLNRPVPLWESHPAEVMAVLAFILLETGLIAVLVVQRRRRRVAEEAVRKSEAKYRSLYESMMDGFVLVDMDGPIREFNESYRGMTGYEKEELLKVTYQDLTPERWHGYEREIVERQVLVRGYSDVYQKEYRKKDGTVFPVELRSFLLKDDRGNNTGMWAIVRDVTERKSAEEALAERFRFERFLSDLSARFVNIPTGQVDPEIEGGLRQVLEFFQVDRCGLIRVLQDKAAWVITHAAYSDYNPPIPLGVELPRSINPWAYDRLTLDREVVSYSRIGDVPDELAIDKKTWSEWGIRSNLTIPIITGGSVGHVISINSVRRERVWPEEFIPRLRLLGEIFVNALERRQIRLELEERLRFERLASELSSRFVNLAAEEVDLEITRGLRSICEFFGVDRSSIGVFSEDGTRLVRLYEFHAEQAPPPFESVSKEETPWYMGQLSLGKTVVMGSVEDLPGEAENEQRFCRERGIKSVLSVPLVSGGKTLAAYSLVSARAERAWPEELVQRFRSISELFTHALERKRAETMLRASEEKFRQFFSHIPEYCYIVSPDGMILDVNDRALDVLGYERDELIGKPLATVYAPESRQKMKELFDWLRDHGELENEEMTIITRDGSRRVVLLNAGVVRDKDGAIIHSASVQTDITERKQAEKEAFAARRELLRTERLLRMGELTASLAHELNQPLTSILSNARAALRFIQSGNLDLSEFKEILEDIAQDDRRASEIIRSLRSMVRPEEGHRSLLSLNEVVREAASLFHSESIIRNIRVETDLAEELPPVMVDKVLILQVLVNLLMNAAESMGVGVSGGRELLLATEAVGEGTVRVAVRDVGAGIAAEDLRKVFDPFFTTKRSGLGMGLSLSRSIVEAHGGRIWVENNPDRGVTFYFELPPARQ